MSMETSLKFDKNHLFYPIKCEFDALKEKLDNTFYQEHISRLETKFYEILKIFEEQEILKKKFKSEVTENKQIKNEKENFAEQIQELKTTISGLEQEIMDLIDANCKIHVFFVFSFAYFFNLFRMNRKS